MHLEYHDSCPQRRGQNGHGVYNPNGGMPGRNGGGSYNPNGMVGQNGGGIYNPNGAMQGQNNGGVYNPNGFAGQNGGGVYNPNGAMQGQNGGGMYNPNGFAGQNGHGTYNPNGAMPGQNTGGNGHGMYNPNRPGQNGGGMYNPNRPGQNGGGVNNPNGVMPGQNGQQNVYSCPLPDVYLAGFAAGENSARSQVSAIARCDELAFACAGITCSSDDRCTVRAGGNRMASPSGEFSLVKGEPCNQAGNQAGNQADNLWPQHGDDNTRCTRGASVIVGSRLECQELALRENHPFYFFSEPQSKCAHSETCDSPTTGTRNLWRVYALPLWPQHGEANSRCTPGGTVDVSNVRECEELAIQSGHPFYHFRWSSDQMDAGKCGTAEVCEHAVVGTNQDWRIFRNPVATTAAVNSFQGSR